MIFRVGQKVVCVDDTGWKPGAMPLVKGQTYTIRALNTTDSLPTVLVEEVPWDFWEEIEPGPHGWFFCGFCRRRFRPVVTTDISVFTAMLAPAPKERADA